MAEKRKCPVDRDTFNAHAKAIEIVLAGSKRYVYPRQFDTGSMGWNLNEKIIVEITGVHCTVQVGLNMTIVGSKDLPR